MQETTILGVLGEAPEEREAETLRLIRLSREGLSTAAVEHLIASGRITLAELDRLIMPRRTWSHRRKTGRLTPEQSDRVIRLARILAASEDTFGEERAGRWLRRGNAALAGEAPLDRVDTEEGARQVEGLIARIAYGLAA